MLLLAISIQRMCRNRGSTSIAHFLQFQESAFLQQCRYEELLSGMEGGKGESYRRNSPTGVNKSPELNVKTDDFRPGPRCP